MGVISFPPTVPTAHSTIPAPVSEGGTGATTVDAVLLGLMVGMRQDAGNLSLRAVNEGLPAGDPRGTGAKDFQTERTASSQVPTGSSASAFGRRSSNAGNVGAVFGQDNMILAGGNASALFGRLCSLSTADTLLGGDGCSSSAGRWNFGWGQTVSLIEQFCYGLGKRVTVGSLGSEPCFGFGQDIDVLGRNAIGFGNQVFLRRPATIALAGRAFGAEKGTAQNEIFSVTAEHAGGSVGDLSVGNSNGRMLIEPDQSMICRVIGVATKAGGTVGRVWDVTFAARREGSGNVIVSGVNGASIGVVAPGLTWGGALIDLRIDGAGANNIRFRTQNSAAGGTWRVNVRVDCTLVKSAA